MPDEVSVQGTDRDQRPPAKTSRDWSWPRFARNAGLIGGGIALAVWFAVEGVVPNLVPKNFGTVEPGLLYRSGGLTTAAFKGVVETHGIRTVVDLGGFDTDPAADRRAQRAAEAMGVRRVVLPLSGDATGDPNRYVEALRIITDPAAQPVLIHCSAGAHRTGCAVALFRAVVEGWDDERALREAENFRHDPEDNPRLREMYFTWRDEIEKALHDGGVIALPGD